MTGAPSSSTGPLSTISGPARALPDESVAELFALRVTQTPDRVAACDGDATVTYAELNRRAESMAAMLSGRRIGRGDVVGIRMSRSLRLPECVLALWRVGAAYLALDPALPEARATLLADDGGVRFTIEDHEEGPVLHARQSGTEPQVIADDTAYLAYTSGSTGRPKGVVVTHRSVSNLVAAATDLLGISESDVVLAVSSLSFDIAVLELWCTLTISGTLVFAHDEEVRDGAPSRSCVLQRGYGHPSHPDDVAFAPAPKRAAATSDRPLRW